MERLPVNKLKANPNNPRVIRDEKFKKLVKSIKEFPEMLEARPVVVNPDMVVLGGNMRLKALREAGVEEAPVYIASWDEVKQRQFIIKDNVGFGEWDWDALANEWNEEELQDWGLDIPGFEEEPDFEDLIGEDKDKAATMKITFESPKQLQKAEIDIQELLDRKFPGAYFSVSAGEI